MPATQVTHEEFLEGVVWIKEAMSKAQFEAFLDNFMGACMGQAVKGAQPKEGVPDEG